MNPGKPHKSVKSKFVVTLFVQLPSYKYIDIVVPNGTNKIKSIYTHVSTADPFPEIFSSSFQQ
jgi:hypothetical protein